MTKISPVVGPRGWILYDGKCGLCSHAAHRAARWLLRRGYRTAALQDPWVTEKLGQSPGFDPAEMILLTRDGIVLRGVDAYVHIAREVRWLRPLAHIASWRWADALARRLYAEIARRRGRISAVCRLSPERK